jgi:hypothetical protein
VTMPRLRAAAAPALILSLVLAACAAVDPSGFGIASPSATAQATESLPPSAQPSSSPPASADPSSEPTDDLGPFACDYPVTGVGTVPLALITDIRVGAHDGYDRVVFQFNDGIPQFRLDEAIPPLLADGSGLPIEVDGNAFWQLVMQGGTRVNPEGGFSYAGPTDFTPGFNKLTQLVTGGDFEAVSTWYFGLEASSCVRVITLTNPSRLVIDVEH